MPDGPSKATDPATPPAGAVPAGTIPADAVATLSGLEILTRIAAGTLPQAPMASRLGFRLVAARDGWARFEGMPTVGDLNPLGTVHGGWIAAILDSALGCAVHATCPAGIVYTTLEFKLNLVRPPVPAGGILRAEERVRHRGRRTATSEADLVDAEGRLLAHGSGTCLLMERAG